MPPPVKRSKIDVQADAWSLVITSKKSLVHIPWGDLWRYRDLLYMFVKRDIITTYKQTIFGPVWFFVQPILTVLVYMVVFSGIADLSTDGLPPVLFYLAGVIIWSYFQECFHATAKTFTENANLFGKVYFPRVLVPLSKIVSGLIRFAIQFILFLIVYGFYAWRGLSVHPTLFLVGLPMMILTMAMLGLGLGMIFSALTTKYRDLVFVMQFGVQLAMYATPVIYPLSSVPPDLRIWIELNPMTAVLEGFRYAFLGIGDVSVYTMFVSLSVSGLFLLTGLLIFNYVEKNFMDTI